MCPLPIGFYWWRNRGLARSAKVEPKEEIRLPHMMQEEELKI